MKDSFDEMNDDNILRSATGKVANPEGIILL